MRSSAEDAASDRREHRVCGVDDIPPGGRQIVEIEGRTIGVFNVAGRFYALHNGCPHKGGALCEGPICGTTESVGGKDFTYVREGHIVRCAWHGWEFDITTGEALADPTVRARSYPVRVRGDSVMVAL